MSPFSAPPAPSLLLLRLQPLSQSRSRVSSPPCPSPRACPARRGRCPLLSGAAPAGPAVLRGPGVLQGPAGSLCPAGSECPPGCSRRDLAGVAPFLGKGQGRFSIPGAPGSAPGASRSAPLQPWPLVFSAPRIAARRVAAFCCRLSHTSLLGRISCSLQFLVHLLFFPIISKYTPSFLCGIR